MRWVDLLIYLAIVVVVAIAAWYLIGLLPNAVMQKVAYAVVIVIGVIVLLNFIPTLRTCCH